MKSIDCCVALTVAHSAKEATTIAETLVDEMLVASVSIVSGVASTYYWQGKRRRVKEWLLIMKMRQDRVFRLKQRLPQLRSYTCPDLVILPIIDGHPDYLAWLRQ